MEVVLLCAVSHCESQSSKNVLSDPEVDVDARCVEVEICLWQRMHVCFQCLEFDSTCNI